MVTTYLSSVALAATCSPVTARQAKWGTGRLAKGARSRVAAAPRRLCRGRLT